MTLPICPHCKQRVKRKFGDIAPACIDCGAELPNGRLHRCEPCRKQRLRETCNESHRRRYKANPRKFIEYQLAYERRKKAV